MMIKNAFMQLSRLEGIIPALESAHAMKIANNMSSDKRYLLTCQVAITRMQTL